MSKIFLFILFATSSVALNSFNVNASSAEIISKTSSKNVNIDEYFKKRLIHLNQLLINKKEILKRDDTALSLFVKKNVLPLWSSVTTLKALLGSKHWRNLAKEKQKKLNDEFNLTIERYVREGMKFYDKQNFTFVSTQIGKKGTKGLLTIKIEPELLPAIDVSFKMIKIQGDWHLYDVMLAGISYVKMKKLEFRQLHKEKGIDAVLERLKQKNSIQQNKKQTD